MDIISEKGNEFKDGCCYIAKKRIFDIFLGDTKVVKDEKYDTALRIGKNSDPAVNAFVYLKDKKDIVLDFNGATIILHGKIQPFIIDGCENITIKNVSIKYDRPPYTELEITEKNTDSIRCRLNKNCPCRIEDGKLIPYSDTWENNELNAGVKAYQVFDKKSRKGLGAALGVCGNEIAKNNSPWKINRFRAKQDGEDIILQGEVPDFFDAGRVLEIAHEKRDLCSVFAVDCKNIHIENYRIISGFGMGIVLYRVENLLLDRLILTHDDESQCIAANAADALHTFACSGKLEIKNCVFEGMMDDAINIHSSFNTFKKGSGNKMEVNIASCEIEASLSFAPGDTIFVYKGKTMEKSAEYVIRDIKRIDKKTQLYILDRPVMEHHEGDLIENISRNAEVVVHNCKFGKSNMRLRLQTRGRIHFFDCEFELSIWLTGDASYWFESGPVTDMTVENCNFIADTAIIKIHPEIMVTEKEPYYHKNIKVLRNTFKSDKPIEGEYADNIVFCGNTNSQGKKMTIFLTNCGKVTADNCEIKRKTKIKTNLGIN